ncbi:MAG: GNAT family N-acetyltransferase [Solirubrobacterales bacterium]|nr:GNAT family N-acetyltransferase [Solirubrobacterales bacterium]MBV9714152.1 GNAT family N-acetyltransferase [Solirubrobacterales bacterium]
MSTVLRLRDGSEVVIRPIGPDDRDRLRAGFEGLSDRSRYLRFHGAMTSLSERQLSYLTEIDHHDHEALIAVEVAGGDIVGVARFVRLHDGVAECAITIADDWQGRGLGTELLARLVERAREENVERFTAVVLAENVEAIRLLEHLGDSVRGPAGAQVELDIALPAQPRSDARIRALLRAAASGALVPAISMWRVVADFAYARRANAVAQPANAIVAHAFAADSSAPAVRAAGALASARRAHVHLVESYWPRLSDRDSAEGRLASAAADLRAEGLEVTVHLRGGDLIDALIDVAEDSAASLIVVDPRAASAVMPWRPRLLSDGICARAPCDVLLAR